MNLYLAGILSTGNLETSIKFIDDNDLWGHINLLESFFYFNDRHREHVMKFKSFMLDSGAYTLSISKKGSLSDRELNMYIDGYESLIVDLGVKMYFEMDLDYIKGYDWVVKVSDILERDTGVKPIPVWHPNRGKKGFECMCERYNYVAIGTTTIRKELAKSLKWFTSTAHRYKSKIHGLGYTKLDGIESTGFDSVDSTTWIYSNISGVVYRYDNGNMEKHKAPKGKKVDIKKNICNSLMQWSKMIDYLDGR